MTQQSLEQEIKNLKQNYVSIQFFENRRDYRLAGILEEVALKGASIILTQLGYNSAFGTYFYQSREDDKIIPLDDFSEPTSLQAENLLEIIDINPRHLRLWQIDGQSEIHFFKRYIEDRGQFFTYNNTVWGLTGGVGLNLLFQMIFKEQAPPILAFTSAVVYTFVKGTHDIQTGRAPKQYQPQYEPALEGIPVFDYLIKTLNYNPMG